MRVRPFWVRFVVHAALCIVAACAPSGGVGGMVDSASDVNTAVQQSTDADAEAATAASSSAQPELPEVAPYTFTAQTTSGLLTFRARPDLCIDVFGDSHDANSKLEVFTCNSGPNQQFALSGNALLVYGNRCVAPTSAAAHAPLVITLCNAQERAQQWLMASDNRVHWLVDPNRCLGASMAADAALTSGMPVGLATCSASGAGQVFDVGIASSALPNLPTTTLPFTHEPATADGVTWTTVPGTPQMWPSAEVLDWSPYIRQGAGPDCTFMSGLGALALHHHERVRPLLRQTGPHTYQAGFFTGGPTNTASPLALVWVEVDDKLAVNADGQTWYAANPVPDAVTKNPVLFAALMEKAYALYLEHYRLDGTPSPGTNKGYADTLGDSPGVAMVLAGAKSLDTDKTGFDANNAWTYLAMAPLGYPVCSAKAQETADGLPGGHVYYAIDAWTTASGIKMVRLRNPWGFDNAAVSVKLTGSVTGTFDMPFTDFMAEFNEVCVTLVPSP